MLCQFRHAHQHALQEAVLIVLLLSADLAGVNVGADHGQGFAVGQNVVRLNPAARIVKVLFANIRAGRDRLVLQDFTGRVGGAAGRHQHTGAPLRCRLRVQNMPLGFVQQLTHDSVGGAHLLQAENVDVTARQPRRHILLVGGSDTVHIHARHAKQTARARCRGVRKMHSLNYASLREEKFSLVRVFSLAER